LKKREGSGAGSVIQRYRSEDRSGTPSVKVQKMRRRIYLQPELQKCVLSISGIQGFFQGQQGQLNFTDKKKIVFSISVVWAEKLSFIKYEIPEPVFLNVYGVQKSIPRNEFRQPMQPGGPVR
jgi:hypothetical protein